MRTSALEQCRCRVRAALVVGLLLAGTGCEMQSRGFVLPPGDAEQGKATFVELGCNTCHTLTGIELAASDGEPPIRVALGGRVSRVKTYGDLVTSIINPSHWLARGDDPTTVTADGTSKMRVYNDVMTVTELIDLTAFLQAQYEVWVPVYDMYMYH